ncbi:aldolase catalytic domain-containing protein [Niallia taxi]|uniref:aldolase catalytic domain-containing protein n=1 Tax=Niallia taxi TaxID=2499688 RepID=UPI0011A63A29|nr:aldolase catalytic domain-containing protein [Niallia taxi]MCT2345694.1 aldolase catalytic domain-containing protein [Niallia taxi]MDE5054126.1 aldolase catalytic domain-containing protein [Niallia taxi]MED3961224.1 aldolase catalytic domain-containing protein [Niallia taxi]WOD64931.1 aldolase catalytic domain-containing protein [Niallia taxi]
MEHHSKIIDCTIRDGGLVNNWDFSVEFVQDLYNGLSEAGVEYMEIGYKNSAKLLNVSEPNPWRFLDDNFLKEIIPEKKFTKLSALVDIGRVDPNDVLPREQSVLDMIRVACYIREVDKGLELVKLFHDLGYETSLNIMALSSVPEKQLIKAFDMVKASPVDVVYIVDSFGSLDPSDIEHQVNKFKAMLPNKKLGIHTHNNMQLAFANTLTAYQHGVTFLDSSVYGMGRAAGNCNTELLVGYIQKPSYELKPVLGVIEKHMVEMRQKWEWGYIIPYMISGVLNEHPRVAMAYRDSEDRDKFVDFYDKVTTPESSLAPASK